MLFGSNRDFDLLVGINRELLKDIIEQEIGYYKLSLNDTQANIYGEALEKIYLNPVKLNCLITRGDQVVDVDEFGPDLGREASFAFIRQDLVDPTLKRLIEKALTAKLSIADATVASKIFSTRHQIWCIPKIV